MKRNSVVTFEMSYLYVNGFPHLRAHICFFHTFNVAATLLIANALKYPISYLYVYKQLYIYKSLEYFKPFQHLLKSYEACQLLMACCSMIFFILKYDQVRN